MTGNRFSFIGRMVKNPELGTVGANARKVCNFALAANIGTKDNENVVFPEFVAWGVLAERICQYVKKGDMVCVDSHYTENMWKDSENNNRKSIRFVIDGIQFLNSKNSHNSNNSDNTTNDTQSDNSNNSVDVIMSEDSDDLPF